MDVLALVASGILAHEENTAREAVISGQDDGRLLMERLSPG
jgi:hypothetical protein